MFLPYANISGEIRPCLRQGLSCIMVGVTIHAEVYHAEERTDI